MGFFQDRALRTICPGWDFRPRSSWSLSWVARITGVSPQHLLANMYFEPTVCARHWTQPCVSLALPLRTSGHCQDLYCWKQGLWTLSTSIILGLALGLFHQKSICLVKSCPVVRVCARVGEPLPWAPAGFLLLPPNFDPECTTSVPGDGNTSACSSFAQVCFSPGCCEIFSLDKTSFGIFENQIFILLCEWEREKEGENMGVSDFTSQPLFGD
jgi:hypothetical protein